MFSPSKKLIKFYEVLRLCSLYHDTELRLAVGKIKFFAVSATQLYTVNKYSIQLLHSRRGIEWKSKIIFFPKKIAFYPRLERKKAGEVKISYFYPDWKQYVPNLDRINKFLKIPV